MDESRINHEIAKYVTKYFDDNKELQLTTSQVLFRAVKRSLKSTLAVLSLWFPYVHKLIASKKDPVKYVYANLVERFMSEESVTES